MDASGSAVAVGSGVVGRWRPECMLFSAVVTGVRFAPPGAHTSAGRHCNAGEEPQLAALPERQAPAADAQLW